jgi:four helix bundle protein
MNKENKSIAQKKSFSFAIKIVNLYKYLSQEKREYVLSKQILRSGTSIGANIEEAVGAQSIKDFINKMSISYKEARETVYWLKILLEGIYITTDQFQDLYQDADELCKIIFKTKTTMFKKLNS